MIPRLPVLSSCHRFSLGQQIHWRIRLLLSSPAGPGHAQTPTPWQISTQAERMTVSKNFSTAAPCSRMAAQSFNDSGQPMEFKASKDGRSFLGFRAKT